MTHERLPCMSGCYLISSIPSWSRPIPAWDRDGMRLDLGWELPVLAWHETGMGWDQIFMGWELPALAWHGTGTRMGSDLYGTRI